MPSTIAYLCMEFGLHESFPIYAGGLGILAGDFMKSAHDLRLPVVGVGLRYAHGYSRQRIGTDGVPVSEFPPCPTTGLADTGVRVRVRVAAREVEARVWRTEHWGNAPLFLLEPVAAQDAWITSRLYDPTLDCRVAQEILLGVGGVRALRKLGIDVDTYHFNEGHAVFAGVELIAERMAAGSRFDEARAAVRDRIVFTTHTPVPAGNEVHSLAELRRLGACCELVDGEMRQLGGDPFNMTVAGLRLSRRANAVSALHGEVSREMWNGVDGAPIIPITNGVHVPTWQDEQIRAAGADSARLWTAHTTLKRNLLDQVARALRRPSRPRRVHDRLRAPRGGVQAQRPRLPRSRAHRAPAARTARPVHLRRQGAPRRPGRASHPRQPDRHRPALARGGRVRARLRHGARPPAHARRRRLAEQSAAPAGSVRHLRA